MYHPGRVMRLFSPKDKDIVSADESVHALVEMWDEHIFTVLVDERLAQKIKEGDIVIVDYYPISPQSQVPKRVVMKILRGKSSEFLWQSYKKYQQKQAFMKDAAHEHEYMD